MGKVKTYLWMSMITISFACGFLNNGFYNEYGQFVPKRPRFKLKDKPQNKIIENIDTVNVFKLSKMYYEGKEIYPNREVTTRNYYPEYNTIYIKFFSNGRVLTMSIPSMDSLGNLNNLNEKDLNPRKSNSFKKYYYGKDLFTFEIESFVRGESIGYYLRSKYMINAKGDTLTREMFEGKGSAIYVKEPLPKHWKRVPGRLVKEVC